MANSPSSSGPPSSARIKPDLTDTPPPKAAPVPSNPAGSVVDMALPPVEDKAESSDIFSPGGRRGGSDALAANGPQSDGMSDLFSADPSRGTGSDILSAKLKSGESDVLAAMLAGNPSDVIADSSSRGSSLFDDPVHNTEPISPPRVRSDVRAAKTPTPPEIDPVGDDKVEQMTDRMPQPELVEDFENAETHEMFIVGDDSGDDLVPTGGKKPPSSVTAIPRGDGEDIFGDQTIPEFDPGGASGVNLLDPGMSATAASLGPSSGVNLLDPGVGIATPAPLVGPPSGPAAGNRTPRNPTPTRPPESTDGKSRTAPPSSLITPEELTQDVQSLPGRSDAFTDLGQGSNVIGGVRSSILPGGKPASDAISFDLPDNRIKQPQRVRGYEGSGMIDWTEAGADSDQHSQRISYSDDQTEHEIDLHEGLMADAAVGKGFTKSPGQASFPARVDPAVRKAPILGAAEKTARNRLQPVGATKPGSANRSGIYVGMGLGLLAASVAGIGLYFTGVLSLKDNRVNAATYAGLKDGNAKMRDEIVRLEETLTQTKTQADVYMAERDRQTTDRVRLGEERLKLEKENTTLKTRVAEAVSVTAERDKLAAEQKALAAELTAARTRASDAEKAVVEKEQLAVAARSAVTAAEAKWKAADAALDVVLKELTAADLIDPKADRSAALKALPTAVKKAAEGALGTPTGAAGQLTELAKKLTSAREEAAKARADAVAAREEAEKSLTLAKAEAKKTTSALETKIKALTDAKDTDVKEAVAKIRAELDGKVVAAESRATRSESELRAAVTAYEQKLQTQADAFRNDLIMARAGITAAVTDSERKASDRAQRLYGDGVTAYFEGRWADAEAAFASSTQADAADARRWYFLGLARWARGDTVAAKAAFRTGAEWEARNTPNARQVGAALERIQGQVRTELDAIRP